MLAVDRYRPQAYPPSMAFAQFGDDQLGHALRWIGAKADARAARKQQLVDLHTQRLGALGLVSASTVPDSRLSPQTLPPRIHYAPDAEDVPTAFKPPPEYRFSPFSAAVPLPFQTQSPTQLPPAPPPVEPPRELELAVHQPIEQNSLENFFDAEEPASPSRLQRLREHAGVISEAVRGPRATAASATFVGTNTGIRLAGRAASSARSTSVSLASAGGRALSACSQWHRQGGRSRERSGARRSSDDSRGSTGHA